MDLFPKVQSIVATTLKVLPDKITRETSDKDLTAWDSLAHVNLMMSLEQTFDLLALPNTAGIGWLAINLEGVS